MAALTQEIAKKLFYQNNDGVLLWRNGGRVKEHGNIAGTKNSKSGHISVTVNGRHYYAHRIVWHLHYGYFPEYDMIILTATQTTIGLKILERFLGLAILETRK